MSLSQNVESLTRCRFVAAALFAAMVWAATVPSGQAAEQRTPIEVAGAYLRAVPPGQTETAAYLTLRNQGTRPVALIAASSPAASATELHATVKENGLMKMRPVARIEIPAGGEARLEPGGHHIMLIGLREPLVAGKTVELELRFDDGTVRRVQAPVRATTPTASGAGQSPDHHHAH
jgi:copper(I)-binding protein